MDPIIEYIARFYLDSPDFNGCPQGQLFETFPNVTRSQIGAWIESGDLELVTGEMDLNPHIRRFPSWPIERQIAELGNAGCMYPTKSTLAQVVRETDYVDRPYTRALALGEHHLAHRSFELSVLEMYRNDPRYSYDCDDTHGSIVVTDEHNESTDMRESEKVYLQTFGFSYNERFDRAVASFVTYLSRLTPQHQQLWHAKDLGDGYHLHPDFITTQIVGDWPERLPIFQALPMEMQVINAMAEAMGRPPFFRETVRPKKLSFLLRPTSNELHEFVHLLDKLLGDNINKAFFLNDIPLEDERKRKDGKIVVTPKGTIRLLDEWLRSRFRPENPESMNGAISTLKRIRKLRQNPAHSISKDVFDQKYFHEQRALAISAYVAIRTIRLIFANHPSARNVHVHPMLFDGKISDF